MTQRHALLQRQLKRHACDPSLLPEPFRRLIEDVNEAYQQSDADRKLLERSLDLSSNELLHASSDMRAVLQAFPDLFFRLGSDGTILACKSSAEGGLIASPSALVGKRIQDVPDEEVRHRFDRALAQVRGRQQTASLEYTLSSSTFEARLVPMGSAEIIAIVRDITERRRTELALRQREEELRQSQKMEAIGRLAGGIAHDFNNLLTILLTCCETLDGRAGAQDQDTLDVMSKTVGRAAELTRQLLTFSRRQVVQPRIVPLDETIAGVLPLIQRTIGELIEVRTELDSAAKIEVDPGQLEQVVLNLVLNARDAMPRGGRVTIATTVEPRVPRTAWLCVRDTGAGMSEATRLRVFEPFFTTKEPGKGTGLGLSTVHGIVTQAGGTIDVTSEPGKGTEFRVQFPVATRATDASPEPAAPLGRGGGSRILLVEDDAVLRRRVRHALEADGHVVIEAGSPSEAIEQCRTAACAVDLLLTDVVMPGMGGRELARLAQCLLPDLRVLLMSGHEDETAAEAGSLDLIRKPFGPRALAAKIREVMCAAVA